MRFDLGRKIVAPAWGLQRQVLYVEKAAGRVEL